MFEETVGEKVFPVAIEVPPVAFVYQFTVPPLAVAPKVIAPVPHLSLSVVAVMVGTGFTVTTIALLVLEQPSASVTVII